VERTHLRKSSAILFGMKFANSIPSGSSMTFHLSVQFCKDVISTAYTKHSGLWFWLQTDKQEISLDSTFTAPLHVQHPLLKFSSDFCFIAFPVSLN
jgi:hypothetical protein